MIEGVEFKELVTHLDERGFFRELIRNTDVFYSPGFGQLSHSLVHHGVIKGWHGHKVQKQWNYVLSGVLKVILIDYRQSSPTYKQRMEFLVGDNHPPMVYAFPAGILHGYQCLQGPAHILYVTSGTYDIDEEIRIPYGDIA